MSRDPNDYPNDPPAIRSVFDRGGEVVRSLVNNVRSANFNLHVNATIVALTCNTPREEGNSYMMRRFDLPKMEENPFQ
ncbi:MAG: hypothetical protein A2945_05025 [Candidatus Liptonbacteria bacterium RIFCSPLOWO2_01_FULL_52_25]|uniref:Uncharacterized protein n=1 Tax=Candidatus Liptonbacteria bacterium RIFCSPLOWO2_01_FULL_52_25 TaxID=1798650 RepID=A0A1G2CDM4_9BACT|nr:MAG: hypothetical protein A2945_05025 [Candidatus Liptonbacteria bacterium RIFCSPLOWO2_01_FULL_52_25]